jgi:formylglycine-generating enzyme required for sulfatase activity
VHRARLVHQRKALGADMMWIAPGPFTMVNDAGAKHIAKPVGGFSAGASRFGILDMAGNVDEWVHEFFAAGYYASAPDTDPPGTGRGQRGMRVGSYQVGNEKRLITATRAGMSASTKGATTGFRRALARRARDPGGAQAPPCLDES